MWCRPHESVLDSTSPVNAALAVTATLSACPFSFLDVIPHHLDVLDAHRRGLDHDTQAQRSLVVENKIPSPAFGITQPIPGPLTQVHRGHGFIGRELSE
ncbi:hypothetical protein J7T55_004833 [Diaporthe amygdali]|uniref:uncharacterized protein n=1 Tax=Phomopsis amygdali TaxID=1214568 RepID=UPI0022FE3DEA|nr:uncharacterized protein J7T55_004833 [Diaporthe amygdali]KAJ0114589.1 hypothetical protein J7T55_004833 [Diaporthe amygdali]